MPALQPVLSERQKRPLSAEVKKAKTPLQTPFQRAKTAKDLNDNSEKAEDLGSQAVKQLNSIVGDDGPRSRSVKEKDTEPPKDKDARDVAVIRAVYANVRRAKAGKSSRNHSVLLDADGLPKKRTAKEHFTKVTQQVAKGMHEVMQQKKVMDIFPAMMQETRVKNVVQEFAIPAFQAQNWQGCLDALLKASSMAAEFEQGAELKKRIHDTVKVCNEIIALMEECEALKSQLLMVSNTPQEHVNELELTGLIEKAKSNWKSLGALAQSLQSYIAPYVKTGEPDLVTTEELKISPDFEKAVRVAEKVLTAVKVAKRPSKAHGGAATAFWEGAKRQSDSGPRSTEDNHQDGDHFGTEGKGGASASASRAWSRVSMAAKASICAGWISDFRSSLKKGMSAADEYKENKENEENEENEKVPVDYQGEVEEQEASPRFTVFTNPPPGACQVKSLRARIKATRLLMGCASKPANFFDSAFVIDPEDGDGEPPPEGEPPPLLYVRKVHARRQIQRQVARRLTDTDDAEDAEENAEENTFETAAVPWEDWQLAVHHHLGQATPSSSSASLTADAFSTLARRPQSSSSAHRAPVSQRPNRHVESVCVERQYEPQAPPAQRVHKHAETVRRAAAETDTARANRTPKLSDFVLHADGMDEKSGDMEDHRWAGPSQMNVRVPLGRKPATGDYWTTHRMASLHAKFARDAMPREKPSTLRDDPSERPRPRPTSASWLAKTSTVREPTSRPASAAGHISSGNQPPSIAHEISKARPISARAGASQANKITPRAMRKRPGTARAGARGVEEWCEILEQRNTLLEVP
eukprot:gnl/MRDRNA2_/MRDRNA2_79088_c0_seq1.p1 gnl/MRDRNA2_/MRDRNA2_79088_c0~~gnl/MRDRNA2_/MRDRNA2_79088_c0_seq1.p1  ORF type:complete len:810 (-),score=176.00 gnl/MRDRNA2_/MRDRNA2_79088_c0_seq1:40-2469(-)